MTTHKAILIGGSGATGSKLVQELLSNNSFSKVTSLVRKIDSSIENEKLNQVVVDFEKMEDYKQVFEGNDVAFSCLGTTRAAAGSAEAFRHIDYDFNVKFAQLAKESNIDNMHLVSSIGANHKSWFLYTKTKGEVEETLKQDQFPNLTIWRPGFLNRELPNDDRWLVNNFSKLIGAIKVSIVAKGMVNCALSQLSQPKPTSPTTHIFGNKDIYRYAENK
ncbi:hypothetical protein CYY_000541 [Polysphondylium violaceum]|uniref:NAD(P)-binding domain-containing protein n=1 Tax=Polysphondylium violaceum TaxID=133409 RepID=A0A8J4Q3M4_9MYCE|nr:hypothetical protein CYY_000541 [Polysphondylium violaceum]